MRTSCLRYCAYTMVYICPDFYTAWDVIAKHVSSYSTNPVVAHRYMHILLYIRFQCLISCLGVWLTGIQKQLSRILLVRSVFRCFRHLFFWFCFANSTIFCAKWFEEFVNLISMVELLVSVSVLKVSKSMIVVRVLESLDSEVGCVVESTLTTVSFRRKFNLFGILELVCTW